MTTVTLRRNNRIESYEVCPEQVASIYDIIGDADPVSGTRVPSIESVENAVAEYYHLEDIKRKTRVNTYCNARQVAYYILSVDYRYKLIHIGRHFGFDHTTIIHGKNLVNSLITGRYPDTTLINQLNEIKARINAAS